MDNNIDMQGIEPVRLGPQSRLQFQCHKDVSCFTKCCRGIEIILTPYDIIRLKNRLGLSSQEFLSIYTKPELLEKTDIPVVTLKMLDDENKSCPFVRDDGCIIYSDRPSTCRYYPLGVASLSHREKETADDDEFYFMVREPHCKGFDENMEWTVEEWRKDQGADVHDRINAEWTDLVVKKRTFPKNVAFTGKAKEMFFLGSYNIDKFREFVFDSSFLQRYDVDDSVVEKIRNDEIELLKFGLKWLDHILFIEKEKKVVKGVGEKDESDSGEFVLRQGVAKQ